MLVINNEEELDPGSSHYDRVANTLTRLFVGKYPGKKSDVHYDCEGSWVGFSFLFEALNAIKIHNDICDRLNNDDNWTIPLNNLCVEVDQRIATYNLRLQEGKELARLLDGIEQ